MAISAGIDAWRGGAPKESGAGSDLLYLPSYVVRRAYYQNSVFDDREMWKYAYERGMGLYEGMRPIYNPVRRLVDFYAGKVYPGLLSEDGRPLPEGIPLAIPLAEDMTPRHRATVAQLWQWSNFQALKNVIVTWGASEGDLLVEIDDDVEGGKIRYVKRQGDVVTDLELEADNLKSYAVQYLARDAKGVFTYRKEVSKEWIRKFRGTELVAEYPNPYPFIAARWIKHRDVGADRGAPAPAGSYRKIDHLMALVSHIHDQVHRIVESTTAIAADGDLSFLMGATLGEDGQWRRDPAQVSMLQLPANAKTFPLIPELSLGGSLKLVSDLKEEIENDHPELTYASQLRAINNPTGPSLDRMTSDVKALYEAAQGQYDGALASLFQMGVAIGGWRYEHRYDPAPDGLEYNGWVKDTVQQQRFAGYGFESYDQGKNTVVIIPRLLNPPSATERAESRTIIYGAIQAAVNVKIPREDAMRQEGISEAIIQKVVEAEKQAPAPPTIITVAPTGQNGQAPVEGQETNAGN